MHDLHLPVSEKLPRSLIFLCPNLLRRGSGPVHAASVNSFDLSVTKGRLEGMMEHRFPVVLGEDFTGTVDALRRRGDRLPGWQPGLRCRHQASWATDPSASTSPSPSPSESPSSPIDVDFARGRSARTGRRRRGRCI